MNTLSQPFLPIAFFNEGVTEQLVFAIEQAQQANPAQPLVLLGAPLPVDGINVIHVPVAFDPMRRTFEEKHGLRDNQPERPEAARLGRWFHLRQCMHDRGYTRIYLPAITAAAQPDLSGIGDSSQWRLGLHDPEQAMPTDTPSLWSRDAIEAFCHFLIHTFTVDSTEETSSSGVPALRAFWNIYREERAASCVDLRDLALSNPLDAASSRRAV